MKPIYDLLGVTVGVNLRELSAKEKSALVSKTYTYGYVDNVVNVLVVKKVDGKWVDLSGNYEVSVAELRNDTI